MIADKLLKLISIILISCVLEVDALNQKTNELTHDPLNWPYLQKEFQQKVNSFMNVGRINLLFKISGKINASKSCKDSIIKALFALKTWEGWAVQSKYYTSLITRS